MSDRQDANSAVGEGNKAARPDPHTIPIEDLGKAINSDPEATRLGLFESQPSEAEEETAQEQEDRAVEEPEEDTEAPEDDSDATEAAEDEDESAVEDEPALDPEIELLQRQVSKLERTLSSREGKYGNQQQKIDQLIRENEKLKARLSGDGFGDDVQPEEPGPRYRQQNDDVRGFLVEQASANALNSFIKEHPGLEQEPGFVAAVQALRSSTEFSSDPRLVQREVLELLENAADDFRVEQLRSQRKEKRAQQAESLRKKKRATTLSSSTARSSPKTKTTPDPRDMPMEELQKAIEKGLAG